MSLQGVLFIFLVVNFLGLVLVLGATKKKAEKIVGGVNADEGEFPYQVSLRRNGKHFCGGSIIGSQYILTAAHCIRGIVKPPYSKITVVTGTNYLTKDGEVHEIDRANVHPHYTPGPTFSWHNDIGVLKLTKPITFNEKQRAIDLPSTSIKSGSSGVVSGWGLRSARSRSLPNSLQKINTVVSLSSTCQKYHVLNIYDGHLCATQKVGVGACIGDSGGPLAVNNQVVGIVSFSRPCGVGVPDVYTNVYEYLNFIELEMDE